MSDRRRDHATRHRRWIGAWFALDAFVALFPPLYWAVDGDRAPFLGVPAALAYFVAVATCITASIVAAYWAEARSGEAG